MSKGSDLIVDFDLLKGTEKQLKNIRNEFDGLEEWRDDLKATLGENDVLSAMEEFVNNWNDNRASLIKEIDAVRDLVTTAKNAFKELEDDLEKSTQKKK